MLTAVKLDRGGVTIFYFCYYFYWDKIDRFCPHKGGWSDQDNKHTLKYATYKQSSLTISLYLSVFSYRVFPIECTRNLLFMLDVQFNTPAPNGRTETYYWTKNTIYWFGIISWEDRNYLKTRLIFFLQKNLNPSRRMQWSNTVISHVQ